MSASRSAVACPHCGYLFEPRAQACLECGGTLAPAADWHAAGDRAAPSSDGEPPTSYELLLTQDENEAHAAEERLNDAALVHELTALVSDGQEPARWWRLMVPARNADLALALLTARPATRGVDPAGDDAQSWSQPSPHSADDHSLDAAELNATIFDPPLTSLFDWSGSERSGGESLTFGELLDATTLLTTCHRSEIERAASALRAAELPHDVVELPPEPGDDRRWWRLSVPAAAHPAAVDCLEPTGVFDTGVEEEESASLAADPPQRAARQAAESLAGASDARPIEPGTARGIADPSTGSSAVFWLFLAAFVCLLAALALWSGLAG